jgi:murein DD-endopeptidase MepM/ murein hydrolase activator NlpD
MMTNNKRYKSIICLIKLLIVMIMIITPASGSLHSGPSDTIRITFYYDANLNGRQDEGESRLTKLQITSSANSSVSADAIIHATAGQDIILNIKGKSPGNKSLTVATHKEPEAVILLPQFTFKADERDTAIGLSDGYLTSPIQPDLMKMKDYNSVLKNPARWKKQSDQFYPRGWPYERNYFFYWYTIPAGGLQNTPHLAFDIWAKPGTPVLASAPGKITEPLFDWKFGISGSYGTLYYNHITPCVKIGDMVKRYDVVGYIAEGQGDHVHFEIRPDPAYILEAFPGADKKYFLRSPLRKESVPVPPFFRGE